MESGGVETSPDLAQKRTLRVFKFLEAFNQIKNPVPRVVTEQWYLWLDDVPEAPTVKAACIREALSEEEEDQGDSAVLRVRRPSLIECPRPPSELEGWLEEGWRHPERDIRPREFRTDIEPGKRTPFESVPGRAEALRRWSAARAVWAAKETPNRRADRLFQRLYQLWGNLSRESERLELLLGDGNLVWGRPDGDVHHPLIVKAVQLEFEPNVPEFRVVETDREVELNTGLLRSFPEVDGKAIASCREEVAHLGVHPLAGELTNGFLRRLALALSASGRLVEGREKPPASDSPQTYRRPLLFLRPRAVGFAKVLEGIIADITAGGSVPASLERIVGIARDEGAARVTPLPARGIDVLLSKEANPEQVQIVHRLHTHGAVLVQGPPGTGKSHTIGNLIGHLLAHGKTVLVTSYTAKALTVLRGHVVEELRPLCVSVLENDVESRRELEQAVTQIANRLGRADRHGLAQEVGELEKERARLKEMVEHGRAALRDARMDERRAVVLGGDSWSPYDAARLVAAGTGRDDWIPEPVSPEAPLPLTVGEVEELYRSNDVISADQEKQLATPLPDIGTLLPPMDFEVTIRDLDGRPAFHDQPEWWSCPVEDTDVEALRAAADQLAGIAQRLAEGDEWKFDAALAGMSEEGAQQPWLILARKIDEAVKLRTQACDLLIRYEPRLAPGIDPETQERVAKEIEHHLERGGTVGSFRRLMNREWARFIDAARATGAAPKTREHFQALRTEATLQRLRIEISHRWSRLLAPGGAPSWSELGQHPEVSCVQFADQVRRCLGWKKTVLDPTVDRLRELGLRWEAFLDAHPAIAGERAALVRAVRTISDRLPSVIQGRITAARREQRRRELLRLADRLETGPAAASALSNELLSAVIAHDPSRYQGAFDSVVMLNNLLPAARGREDLLRRLHFAAPAWAEAIRLRQVAHGQSTVPGDAQAAWTWAQLHAELERRGSKSLPNLQARLNTDERLLREVTMRLIERRAWSAQIARTSLEQQQALLGWLDIIRRIGKGTGKRAPILQAEAAQRMRECRLAVPVWIMPLSRVAEMFSGGARFDVVIIDEASQCDVMGLVALYMGSSVVVVGDHEQVSPAAVGQQLDRIGKLIDEHLEGIPNKVLYDGKTSIYDLGRQSFGGLICLSEHFRCHPHIIDFSNWLSYGGRIKPLREPGASALKPAVVPYRVSGATRSEKTNEVEALHVASLLVACTEQPEYSCATFGVVSLLGEDQAVEIDHHLRVRLPEAEYVKRRILCGNAAQFQGDERDVVFLSVVHTSDGSPLPLLTEQMYQQRFNVAASRARDQMWVVYSLDPCTELKPKDLRRRLIEHAIDPDAKERDIDQKSSRTESDFEQRVMERLIRAGYQVHPQYPVGAYRIDLVVEGEGGRVAVECDGEQFHTIENLDDDMARQAILERLGWTFVRVRGSLFYRDAERAMRPVMERLQELGIQPRAASPVVGGLSESRDRVIRRAAELRHEWKAKEMEAGASSPQCGQESDRILHLPQRNLVVGPPAEGIQVARVPATVGVTTPEGGVTPRPRDDRGQPPPLPVADPPGLGETPEAPPIAAKPATPSMHSTPPVAGTQQLPGGRKRLVLEKVATIIPAGERHCSKCGKPLKLAIGRFGPYLRCVGPHCGETRSVDDRLVATAVANADMRCSCGGKLQLKLGKTTFLGCSKYPACRNPIAWSDL